MKRRDILVALVAAALSPWLLAQPQPSRTPRIGFLRHGSPPDPLVDAFLQGLRELGYIDGKTIQVEMRWTEGKAERIHALSEELIRLKVRVIVSAGESVLQALHKLAPGVPVVMATSQNPVGAGFAASLARPGGHMTGVTSISPELAGKRLQLLKEAFPRVARVAMIWDAGVNPDQLQANEAAARLLGWEHHALQVRDADDLERTIATAQKARADALVFLGSVSFFAARARVAALAGQSRLPAIYTNSGFVEAGGMMSYGTNARELFRRSASYVDRILKGAKPGDLPIEQPMRVELAINLKTAKALGLTIPQEMLLRANRVIE